MNDERSDRSPLWRVFLGTLSALAVVQAVVFGWFFFGPTHLDPYAWQPKAIPALSGPYAPNDAITRARLVTTRWTEPGYLDQMGYLGVGPETVAVGPDGFLYTGLCDASPGGTLTDPARCRTGGEAQGWVVRIDPAHPKSASRYVPTGGRPLGMAFDGAGKLYIADARRGLLRVERDLTGTVRSSDPLAEVRAPLHTVVPVATCNRKDDHPDPLPHYADSVAIGPDGSVWFTCPSQRRPLAAIRDEIFESRPTGRVFRYVPCDAADPLRCPKELVVDDLSFANGIAVIDGGRALLVNEWTAFRVTRLTLDADNRVTGRTVFFDNTPGYPDNLTVDRDGTVWVGLSLRRQPLVDRFRDFPRLVTALARLPESLTVPVRYAWVLGILPDGTLAHSLHDPSGMFDQSTGAYPVGEALYLGSYTGSELACIPRPGADIGYDPCDPWDPRRPAPAVAAAGSPAGDVEEAQPAPPVRGTPARSRAP